MPILGEKLKFQSIFIAEYVTNLLCYHALP